MPITSNEPVIAEAQSATWYQQLSWAHRREIHAALTLTHAAYASQLNALNAQVDAILSIAHEITGETATRQHNSKKLASLFDRAAYATRRRDDLNPLVTTLTNDLRWFDMAVEVPDEIFRTFALNNCFSCNEPLSTDRDYKDDLTPWFHYRGRYERTNPAGWAKLCDECWVLASDDPERAHSGGYTLTDAADLNSAPMRRPDPTAAHYSDNDYYEWWAFNPTSNQLEYVSKDGHYDESGRWSAIAAGALS